MDEIMKFEGAHSEFNEDPDEEIIESFQEEMGRLIDNDESGDLKPVDINKLGDNEMRAYWLVIGLNDRDATSIDVVKNAIDRYQDMTKGNREKIEQLGHYYTWLRGKAIESLKEKQ